MNSTQDFIDEVKGCLRENVIVGGDGSIDLSPLYNQIDSVNQSLREHSNNDDAHTSISEAAAIFSNPNLLDNSDFSINQRGQTEYTGVATLNGYTIDRWKQFPSYCSVTTEASGVRLTNNTTVDDAYSDLQQVFSVPLALGKPYTISIELDGEVLHLTMTAAEGFQRWTISTAISVYLSSTSLIIRNFKKEGSCLIGWVKVEPGSVATPFVKPNPAVEMTKCQWFLEVIPLSTMLRAYHANGVEGFSLASPKRVVPTVTVYSADGEEGYLDEPLTSSKVKITGAQASTGAVVNILSDGAFTVHGVYRGKFVISAEL